MWVGLRQIWKACFERRRANIGVEHVPHGSSNAAYLLTFMKYENSKQMRQIVLRFTAYSKNSRWRMYTNIHII